MAVSQASYAKSIYNANAAVGDKVIASDATLVIEGFEDTAILIKNFPHPVLSNGEPIEIPMQMGLKKNQVSQLKINLEGSITITETVAGHVVKALRDILRNGGVFNAKVYEGTPEHYLRYYPIYDCSTQFDQAERAFDDNTTPLDITGTTSYHYFGEVVEGNTDNIKPAFANQ